MNYANPPIPVDIKTQWDRRQQMAGRAGRVRSGPGYRVRRGTAGTGISPISGSKKQISIHPFKIYQFPLAQRKFRDFDPSEGQRFKVHDGRVYIEGAGVVGIAYGSDQITQAGLNPFYTDYGVSTGAQVPPDDGSEWVSDGANATWNEIAIPADGRRYVFWLSFSLPIVGGSWGGISLNTKSFGIAVCPVIDQTDATLMFTGESFDATNVWPTMSSPDSYNIPIGIVIVDDGTYAATYPGWPPVYIEQIQFGNITLPGHPWGTWAGDVIQMRCRGTYSGAKSYYVGDVVTITYADTTGVNSFYQYVYDPPSTSAYIPYKISGGGPLIGVSPNGNTPDPWRLLSKSPSDADYHNGAYDASKFYLRTA